MFLNSNMNSNFYESQLDKYKDTEIQISERLLIRRRFDESGTFFSSRRSFLFFCVRESRDFFNKNFDQRIVLQSHRLQNLID